MKIALAGIGKIARDQHLPAIANSPDWQLAAAISRHEKVGGVDNFTGIEQMLAARPDIEVISLCLPPGPRFAYAVAALKAGHHVMLEKPPATSVADAEELARLARSQNCTLFATWHSRMGKAVAPAKKWLADKTIIAGKIRWHEDVRKWHPGQEWVFEKNGMGVFDPGINALSILTEILPSPATLQSATLHIPANRAMPIAADLQLNHNITASFDWRKKGQDEWTITLETGAGTLVVSEGAHRLFIDGAEIEITTTLSEYPALYARMAELLRKSESDIDFAPLALVEAALNTGKKISADAFEF